MTAGARPRRLIFVTGTATEVGKTWVGAHLLSAAVASGLAVAARKPAQSFADPAISAASEPTDAERLAAATGEDPSQVCPPERSYPVPMAPPMAAAALRRPVPALAELAGAVQASWPAGAPADLGLVEGAGGVASPLSPDGDSADLARALGADVVVVVADPRLGAINSVRLTAGALDPLPVIVHLNRFDPSEDIQRLNAEWLREHDGLRVTTVIDELLDAVVAGPSA